MNPVHYLPRPLPPALEPLADLALDLRWSWNHQADALWQTVDPELWRATGNPWLMLETVSQHRLEALAADAQFLRALEQATGLRERHLAGETWFGTAYGERPLGAIAYFSMEFGLSEALPIYSGGLGILAGDHLKTASDLGVPLVAVGLLYQQGYFRQVLDAGGAQLAFHPYNDPTMLPVMPLRDASGEWLHVLVELPGRSLRLRTWQVQVGRVQLYLLDSNDLLNAPGDRGITGELYGGGPEMRLQQEIVLGIGGWRLLQALGLSCDVCHLNEGHAAFAVLERAGEFRRRHDLPFAVALRATRAGNLFTTHTPVAAGFDRYAPELVRQYLGSYAGTLGIEPEVLLALGRAPGAAPGEPFNMAYLALHGCGACNGVSRLHGRVSRHIFQPLFPRWPAHEVPVGHITNGVHVPSWDSEAADALWTDACGKSRWLGTMEDIERELRGLDDDDLWNMRSQGRRALIAAVRAHLTRQQAQRGAGAPQLASYASLLDPNALTVGLARRFATYKRPTLLLHDRARLGRLLAERERPVQIVVAGKAHPQDQAGQALVREWLDFMRHPDAHGRVVFLADYDLALADELVQGVDLWINTPRRPWEASGTSGMKVLVNGGLNLSELDGWWAEAYRPGVGWAIGDRREHDEDPAWDAQEADALYALLEREVVPEFYTRDARGIPTAWIGRMRESMAQLTAQYSTNRMLREYTERYYLPCAAAWRGRSAQGAALAAGIEQWLAVLQAHWESLHFGSVQVETAGDAHRFEVQVYLDELAPEWVSVQLYAEPGEADNPECRTMTRGAALTGAVHGYTYVTTVPATRPAGDYTPRIVPFNADAGTPLEAGFIVWQR